MEYVYKNLKNYSEKIYGYDSLFFYDKNADMLYTHNHDLAREELNKLGFSYAYSDSFGMLDMTEEMIYTLNEMRSELCAKNNENFTAFVKDCYETLILERTYTATEYKKLLDEKNQLEKTLNAIKGML